MKVLKFGGTSVGTVEAMRNVKSIVEGQQEQIIVVVSALGGITDSLIATARQARLGGSVWRDSYQDISDRHRAMVEAIVAKERCEACIAQIEALLEELGNILLGVSLTRDLSSRALDIIVSYGERMSSLILANALHGDVELLDSRNFIRTVKQYGKHILDDAATQQLIEDNLMGLACRVAVVPGFIAADADGDITNLGRGGSDYTASILAAALDASQLEIWTDVDGFMTADPRVINNALVIESLTFREAMELCNFGAKVIYPPTIYPVYHKNIPILIKNTHNPEAQGTLISSERRPQAEGKPIRGISSINDTALITVEGLGMVGVIGINSRIFNALAQEGISVFLVSQAASENNTSLAVRSADADHALEVLRHEFRQELQQGSLSSIRAQSDLATVAIVGEDMKHMPGVAGKLFFTLGRNGISVIACAQGAAETNISFVIELKNLKKALGVIHDSFFLSEAQELNLFVVGTGNVGRSLLEQIAQQQKSLLADKALKVRLVGVSNSRKCVFDREGIDISRYKELLEESPVAATPDNICQGVIGMNIFNSVFVDCTASPEIAELYGDLLEHNVNVVAANKIAASSDYTDYSHLKATARRRDVKYLFETNVGAGLPIINTINSLINSGDRILGIEAVLSGTLNYIFNVLAADVPLSRAIEMAREAGYSEPDPRIDLSGKDVVRKLVILAREAGYAVEQKDVNIKLFLPEECFNGSVDDFFKSITRLDAQFEAMRAEADAKGLRFRFIARLYDGGKAEVGLQAVGPDSPFYHLDGSNNVILLTTERYHEYPMVIKGYGAGAEVTAAGVFADIISIANIR